MNERLIVKAFGPIRELDIVFKSVTVIIGDQGTGKSCVAKLFTMFKWLEKELSMQRKQISYYEMYNRFETKLCSYHRIEVFLKKNTYIHFESEKYNFIYENNKFNIIDKGCELKKLPKIIYIPAERSILSVAENKVRLFKDLPESSITFQDEFNDAKKNYKNGYNLPFGGVRYEYDLLNDMSKISGKGYEDEPIKLTHASSGIQSALPLCLVSEYLSEKIVVKEELKLSNKEKNRISKQVADIVNNDDYTENVKEMMLKQISALNRYGCFYNITEEPELNLFPESQLGVLKSLVKNNNKTDGNKLVITTHSPYTLAILNLFIMARKVYKEGNEDIKSEVERIIPIECHINNENIVAYGLHNKKPFYTSITNDNTGMISKNDLDSISETISRDFNLLYRLYGKSIK